MSSHLPSSWRPSTRASIGEDLTTQNRTNQTSIAEDYIGKKSIVSPDLSAPLLRVQRNVFMSSEFSGLFQGSADGIRTVHTNTGRNLKTQIEHSRY